MQSPCHEDMIMQLTRLGRRCKKTGNGTAERPWNRGLLLWTLISAKRLSFETWNAGLNCQKSIPEGTLRRITETMAFGRTGGWVPVVFGDDLVIFQNLGGVLNRLRDLSLYGSTISKNRNHQLDSKPWFQEKLMLVCI